RARRARASRFGPGETSTRSRRKPAPNRAAAAARTAASATEPARRPWSTWAAVTRQPAATARTSSASESGPPETAHVTSLPAAGKLERVSSSTRSSAEEVTFANQSEQLANRARAQLAADATQAGVHVRPADLQVGCGLTDRRRGVQHVEQLALLGRQGADALAHGTHVGRLGLRLGSPLQPGEVRVHIAVAPSRRALLHAGQRGQGLLLHVLAAHGLGLALEGPVDLGAQLVRQEGLGE